MLQLGVSKANCSCGSVEPRILQLGQIPINLNGGQLARDLSVGGGGGGDSQ